tara:strand:+ start:2640 stop:2957 length:318 start_codon:yes stop_codon:yes gene_type:complete
MVLCNLSFTDVVYGLDTEMKWGMRELMVVKFTLGATCVFWQVLLIYKYNIQWYDWLIWGVLCVGAITFTRLLGVTEGIIETIRREQYYDTIKQMLFKDDKRNTKN